jgi:UDPglucose 6-dehydrogenase
MKIAVVGLWHLGSVTAACLANAGFEVVAYDPNVETIAQLKNGKPPVFEPGLADLIQKSVQSKKLQFSSVKKDLAEAEIVWITFDTPVDDEDKADTDFVMNEVIKLFPVLNTQAIVLVSSQLPVGSTQWLQEQYKISHPTATVQFACSPENLRLGKAIEVFTKPDRVVIGVNSNKSKEKLEKLFAPFTQNLVWMSIASAEMTKHALNAFLATSVVFINELATLCERVGANAQEVERGLKSEMRIGAKAYLKPGAAFAGGTLARDVTYLIQIGKRKNQPTDLFSAVIKSNKNHRAWSQRRLLDVLGNLQNKTIAMLGLTYKPGTDTLRRSTAIETCRWLQQQGAIVIAHDPVVKQLPQDLHGMIQLQPSVQQALQDADAAIIATEWAEFNSLTVDDFLNYLKQPLLFDPSGFLAKKLGGDNRISYFTVGKSI